MSHPAHYIRRWREFRDISQEDLAAAIGRERSYVSRIENGQRKYDQPFLEETARVLRCEVAELIARDPDDPEGLWGIYAKLSAEQRRQLVDIAKTFPRAQDLDPPAPLSLVKATPTRGHRVTRKPIAPRAKAEARSK